MRIKSLGCLFVGILLLVGLASGLAGCSSGSTQSPEATEPVASTTAEQTDTPSSPPEEAPEASLPEPAESQPEAAMDVPAEPEEQPLLAWTRNAGGLGHCDSLKIFADGRVEAVVCRGSSSEPTVSSNLTEEQLQKVTGWAADYAAFDRREMEQSTAVRTTSLAGAGTVLAELDAKKEISAFVSDLYFELTDPS